MNSKPSKSARKREQLALQALGERLIGLSREQLDGIDLDERLRDAVLAAGSIRAHGALRRQKQLIGKLMRNVDPDPIRAALDALGRTDRRDKRIFHEAESWRDRIAAREPGALTDLFDALGGECEGIIREVEALQNAADDATSRRARRRLFRAIHRELERNVQNAADPI